MFEMKPVKSAFAEIPGARLYYEMAGEGDPLVLLHGGFLDRRMWDEQFQFFAQNYQAIRYDERHSGESKETPSSTPYVHYQDLYHLLGTLQIEKAILIGLSGGARIAIDMAIAYPSMVQKLITISPGMSGYTFLNQWTHDRGTELHNAGMRQDLKQMVEIFTIMWADGPYRTPEQLPSELRQRIREMATHTILKGSFPSEMHELEPPAVNRISEIIAPTLIVLGDKDTSDIHAIGNQLHQKVPNAKLTIISDAGHLLTMEKPDAFNSLVDQFLLAQELRNG